MSLVKEMRRGIALGAALLLPYSFLHAQNLPTYLAVSTTKDTPLLKQEEGWKGFLDHRLEYNFPHRFTIRTTIDMLSESERERVSLSELGGKRAWGATRKSIEQTLREELQTRMTIDDWAEQNIVEPAEEFAEEKIINPVARAITSAARFISSPFRKNKEDESHERSNPYHTGFIQDILTGQEEKNQLVDPFNREGIPGEEWYQQARLPRKLALGVRPFQGSPYGYATIRFGNWYTHARLSAADVFDAPRLNEVSLLLQTELNPHGLFLSFGGITPFKNKKEPERYFGPHGFIGLSKIIVNGDGKYGEVYLEGRAGKEQGMFLSFNLRD